LFLKNTAEQVLDRWGWSPYLDIQATDTISAKGRAKDADVILTSGAIAETLGDLGVPVEVIEDFTSQTEIDGALRRVYAVCPLPSPSTEQDHERARHDRRVPRQRVPQRARLPDRPDHRDRADRPAQVRRPGGRRRPQGRPRLPAHRRWRHPPHRLPRAAGHDD